MLGMFVSCVRAVALIFVIVAISYAVHVWLHVLPSGKEIKEYTYAVHFEVDKVEEGGCALLCGVFFCSF